MTTQMSDSDARHSDGHVPAPRNAARVRFRGIIRRHPLLILLLPLVAGFLAGIYSYTVEPVYQASATLMVTAAGARGGRGGGDTAGQDLGETQVLLLRSRTLAETVADRLELWSHPRLDPRQTPPRGAPIPIDLHALLSQWLEGHGQRGKTPPTGQVRRQVVDTLLSSLRVERIPDSRILRISIRSGDPELTAKVANAYGEAFVDTGLQTRLDTTRKSSDWMSGRLETLRLDLESSEDRLQAYREEQGLLDADDAMALTDRERNDLLRRLVAARAERDGLRADYARVKELDTTDRLGLAAHSVLAGSQVVQALRTDEARAEQTLSELAERYGDQHPRMIVAQSQLRSVRARLQAEIANAISAAGNALDIAEARTTRLEQELETLRRRARETQHEERALRALERDVEAKRGIYEQFLASTKETGVGAGGPIDAHIIDRALIPLRPIAPNRAVIIAAAVLPALLLGVVLAWSRDRRDDRVHVPESVERRIGVQLLGTVPRIIERRSDRPAPERMLIDRPQSVFAESIRTLRTTLVLSHLVGPRRVVLVTSSLPGEGTTTVAVGLALALAQTERVLLVDGDLRRASIANRLGLAVDAPGLSELAAGEALPDDCIQRVEGTGLDLIPSGVLPADPLDRLSTDALLQALADLSQRYDRVLLDSPPVQAVSDALILSRLCQGVIFVIKADSTPGPLIQLAVNRLHRGGAPLIGAVLNGFDGARAAGRGHTQSGPYADAYQGYTQYYREE